ncbi:MAG: GTP-dependent dephospho-CoA kinase family protein [Candidatus Hodarchaeota archaeon]
MGYKLPKSLRKSFREPIGKLFTGNPLIAAEKAKNQIIEYHPELVITIGDYCTKTLFDAAFLPNLIIYDGKTHREKHISLDLDIYIEKRVTNPREWITKNAWETLESTISFCTSNNCRVRVHIDGEEDLLVIPAIILSPLGSVIVYGQPPMNTEAGMLNGGIVVVLITEELKKLAKDLLEQFEFHEEIYYGD